MKYFVVFLGAIMLSSATATKMYDEFLKIHSANSPVQLNMQLFNKYVKPMRKDYHVIVVFTAADPSRGCQPCQIMHKEFNTLAHSLKLKSFEDRQNVFLAVVDFDKAPDLFKLMNFQTAPIVLNFGPKKGFRAAEVMDLQRYGISSHGIAKFINDKCGIEIKIRSPPDYTLISIIVGVIFVCCIIVYLKPKILLFFTNEKFWLVIVMSVIFSMLSGQMWNHIRGAQFSNRNHQNGQINYISDHPQNQFVAESYIISSLYFCVTLGLVLMGSSKRLISRPQIKRKYYSLLGLAIFTFIFSYLLSIFKNKYSGYPYSFLL